MSASTERNHLEEKGDLFTEQESDIGHVQACRPNRPRPTPEMRAADGHILRSDDDTVTEQAEQLENLSLDHDRVKSSEQEAKMDDYLLKTLDEVEKRTEKLREMVKEAETERLFLLQSLNMLMQSQALINVAEGERNELELYMDRLTNRLLTIDISVQIIRSPPQEQSLHVVKTFLRKIQENINRGDTGNETIYRYLNSCMEETNGPVDDRFQGALLGCAAEDQKEIKKQLTAMWEAKDDIDRQRAIFASMELT